MQEGLTLLLALVAFQRQDVLLDRQDELLRAEAGESDRDLEAVFVETLDVVGGIGLLVGTLGGFGEIEDTVKADGRPEEGEKSTVRIARSSWEQNGYERHRTRPVPVSVAGPKAASRSSCDDAEENWKPGTVSRRVGEIFLRESATVNRLLKLVDPGNFRRAPLVPLDFCSLYVPITAMTNRPASWRMPTPKQMENLAASMGRAPARERPLGPADDMPEEYWRALLDDAHVHPADAGRSSAGLRLSQIPQHVLRVSCRRCERIVEIQKVDAIRLYGQQAGWKEVARRLLDNTCQNRTGRHEEDGCWPAFGPV
ncbi:hypothetical protein GA0061098_102380 [Bradyrhizobium shewense]|uniref:Uncharacterized protein n=1 Tax=Bradyrhizobium shewense TaxID=1761772 RepID=A0A1C3XPP9_9BRAD|nr:hypothetical protein GA0061098_102380 [Bradyrhizobium shewense]